MGVDGIEDAIDAGHGCDRVILGLSELFIRSEKSRQCSTWNNSFIEHTDNVHEPGWWHPLWARSRGRAGDDMRADGVNEQAGGGLGATFEVTRDGH